MSNGSGGIAGRRPLRRVHHIAANGAGVVGEQPGSEAIAMEDMTTAQLDDRLLDLQRLQTGGAVRSGLHLLFGHFHHRQALEVVAENIVSVREKS